VEGLKDERVTKMKLRKGKKVKGWKERLRATIVHQGQIFGLQSWGMLYRLMSAYGQVW